MLRIKELQETFDMEQAVGEALDHLTTTHKSKEHPLLTEEEIRSYLETHKDYLENFWGCVTDELCMYKDQCTRWEKLVKSFNPTWKTIAEGETAESKDKLE